METVSDALKALKKASSHVVAARLGISREEAVNELWELKRKGVVDKTGHTWFLAGEGESRVTEERPVKSEAQDMLTGEVEQKVTADMMIEFIGQDGAKTCEELAG
ncbi:DNA replication protein, partial [Escherichia coli]|nr:DNA replication protein [Escherichia coli]EEZ1473857.1 DNA replication protein [Escherichia coli]EJI3770089.1 DNA replication protein [Escherichia coli]ELK7630018.1 DNA replication protein [Escherichia coli]